MNQRTENKNLLALDLLRFPLAIFVLIEHVFTTAGFYVHGKEIMLDDFPILLEINNLIGGFVRGQSVPIYFFISGYLFFHGIRLSPKTYLNKLKRRIRTLLIPYIAWNTIALLFPLIFRLPCFSSILPNITAQETYFSLSKFVSYYWDYWQSPVDNAIYPIDVPLWYIRELMILAIMSPIIYHCIHQFRLGFIAILFIFWATITHWDLGYPNQLLTGLSYFSWGAYFSICKKEMVDTFKRYFSLSIALYIILGILYAISQHNYPCYSTLLKQINIIFGVIFAFNLAYYLIHTRFITVNYYWMSYSFFLYVTHKIVYDRMLQLMYYLIKPTNDFGMITVYVLTAINLLIGSLICYEILRRLSPPILRFLTGR